MARTHRTALGATAVVLGALLASASPAMAVDHLPECRANPTVSLVPMPIYSRPGATRRFALICEDADGDAIVAQIETPPTRGNLTVFDAQPAFHNSSGGTEIWVDVTYVPSSPYEGEDPFEISATGPNGEGPATAMAITARLAPDNRHPSCWALDLYTHRDVPATIELQCNDDDGDPVSVQARAAHGQAGAPASVVGLFGTARVSIPYAPSAGFQGTDLVTIDVDDGLGGQQRFDATVIVSGAAGVPYPIGFGNVIQPPAGRAPLVSPVEQARRALGSRPVRLVKRLGDAGVYALRAAPKVVSARQKVLAVTCPVRCNVTSSSTVGGRAAGSAKKSVSPGRAVALELKLSKAQRSRIRRAGSARAVFRLTVKRTGAKARRATVRLPLRG